MNFDLHIVDQHQGENARLIRERLGYDAYLPEAVLGIYEENHDLLAPLLKSDQERHSGALIFGQCVKHLAIGANSLFRGLASVMYREVRGATETAALANRILNDQPTFEAYARDQEQDEGARKRFRSLTKTPHLFGKDAPDNIKKLGEHYHFASMKAHTNRMNFLRSVSRSPDGSMSEMNLADFSRDNIFPKLPNELAWLCIVHLDILHACTETIYKQYAIDWSSVIPIQDEIHEWIARFLGQHGSIKVTGDVPDEPLRVPSGNE